MKKIFTLAVLALVCLSATAQAAVRGDKAMYVGGSVTTIPEKQEGKLDLSGGESLLFRWKKGKQEVQWELPYQQITRMQYGQKAGRRVGLGVAVAPVFLFSKKRKHYLTIHFDREESSGQVVVFELSKKVYRNTLARLRRGKLAGGRGLSASGVVGIHAHSAQEEAQ